MIVTYKTAKGFVSEDMDKIKLGLYKLEKEQIIKLLLAMDSTVKLVLSMLDAHFDVDKFKRKEIVLGTDEITKIYEMLDNDKLLYKKDNNVSIRLNGRETPQDTAVNIIREDGIMNMFIDGEEKTFNIEKDNVAIIIDAVE